MERASILLARKGGKTGGGGYKSVGAPLGGGGGDWFKMTMIGVHWTVRAIMPEGEGILCTAKLVSVRPADFGCSGC